MKIVHKIILANTFHVLSIAVLYFFVYEALDVMLAKLRFLEISDDLNTSFLEMRLSEKNYFLYHDKSALLLIESRLDESIHSIGGMKADIIRAIGEKKFDQLRLSVENYREVVQRVGTSGPEENYGEARDRKSVV